MAPEKLVVWARKPVMRERAWLVLPASSDCLREVRSLLMEASEVLEVEAVGSAAWEVGEGAASWAWRSCWTLATSDLAAEKLPVLRSWRS